MKILKYLLFLLLLASCKMVSAQVKVIQFNAEWNAANKVTWCKNLTDCKVYYIDIAKYPEKQKKYEIVVVPTIIVLNGGKEVKRYQADISFTMKATLKQVQAVIDETKMESDF